ncbi:MAG: hypothetical protein LAT64_13975 [Phycisphaerales bacterium]|nr:hypothetical protein [Planctomycetota bacterium]MCH8509858.1 hypothetical protein [Phycisphaerales bacterium]
MGHPKSHPAHCVVWTDPSADLPDALARVLLARGLDPVHTRSPHNALAEVCLAEHAGRRAVLILADAPDPERVLAAAERFAPGAVVWIYQPGANPPLRPIVQITGPASVRTAQADRDESRNGHHEEPKSPPPPPEPMRPVRETTLKPVPAPADPIRTDRPLSARDILDDDELEMLLAGEKAMEDDPR